MLHPEQRRQFDEILDRLIEELPEHLRALLEEVPLIVEDEPSARMMDDMHLDRSRTELCGLHWGVPLTKRSVEHSGRIPDQMMLFRGPIFRLAVWKGRSGPRRRPGSADAADESADPLEQQIRITLLHEMGHHFGLD